MTLYLLVAAFWVALIGSVALAAAKQAPQGDKVRAAANRVRELVILLAFLIAAGLLARWLSPNPSCYDYEDCANYWEAAHARD